MSRGIGAASVRGAERPRRPPTTVTDQSRRRLRGRRPSCRDGDRARRGHLLDGSRFPALSRRRARQPARITNGSSRHAPATARKVRGLEALSEALPLSVDLQRPQKGQQRVESRGIERRESIARPACLVCRMTPIASRRRAGILTTPFVASRRGNSPSQHCLDLRFVRSVTCDRSAPVWERLGRRVEGRRKAGRQRCASARA